MSAKTPGGLLLPDAEALDLVKRAPQPAQGEEPAAKPDGLTVDAGYLSPYFITDAGRCVVDLADALVLVTERTLVKPQELVPILERVVRADRALLIVASGAEAEVLAFLVLNKLRGILRVCASATTNLEPIAHHVGCKVVRVPLERLAIGDLGVAKHVASGAKSTVIEAAPKR